MPIQSSSRLSRRALLQRSLVAAGSMVGLLGSRSLFAQTLSSCGLTPPQTEGPFYPVQDQLDKDNDLTQVTGRSEKAEGQVIYIRGKILDQSCQPVSGALVEIWQACKSGKYNHPGDNNPAALDPNFQYWGQALTDEQGNYLFKTILPGAYPAETGWIRPPHIHYKVHKKGFIELTTQLYFEGSPDNSADRILNRVPAAQRVSVIASLQTPTAEFEPESKICDFSLTLRKA